MKKILLVLLIAFLFFGCTSNEGATKNNLTAQNTTIKNETQSNSNIQTNKTNQTSNNTNLTNREINQSKFMIVQFDSDISDTPNARAHDTTIKEKIYLDLLNARYIKYQSVNGSQFKGTEIYYGGKRYQAYGLESNCILKIDNGDLFDPKTSDSIAMSLILESARYRAISTSQYQAFIDLEKRLKVSGDNYIFEDGPNTLTFGKYEDIYYAKKIYLSSQINQTFSITYGVPNPLTKEEFETKLNEEKAKWKNCKDINGISLS